MDENRKIGQEALKTYSDEMEIKLKEIIEIIEKETRKKYVEKLRACVEANKKLKELLANAYDWKRNVIMERIKALKKQIQEKKDSGSDVDDVVDDLKVEDVNLPLLLRPEFEDPLRLLASKMDPMTFTRFIQTCQGLHNMAKNGVFKVPITLSCVSYKQGRIDSDSEDHSEFNEDDNNADADYVTDVLVLKYNKRPLNYLDYTKLHECKWFRPQISSMFLKESQFVEYEANTLLDRFGITQIDYLETRNDVDIYPMLTKYKIKSLNCRALASTELIKSRNINKVDKIKLDFRDVEDDDLEKDIIDFIGSSSIPDIHIQFVPMLLDCSDSLLVEKWLAGEMHFKKLQFDVDFEDDEQVLADVLQKSRIYLVNDDLADVSREEVVEILKPLRPLVICGIDDSFVVIREDLKMLNVFYERDLDEETKVVTMRDLD